MTTKERYSGIQTIMGFCHDNGCHFLSLCSIAEEERARLGFENPEIDFIEASRVSFENKWFTDHYYGLEACLFLEYFTGKKWERSEKIPTLPPIIKDNQYTEVNWYNPATRLEHFTRRNIDTLKNSNTVKNGVIRYYYIYTCKE